MKTININFSFNEDSLSTLESFFKDHAAYRKDSLFLDGWENHMRSQVKYHDSEIYEKVREDYFKLKSEAMDD